jgi:predicted MFS family arabinose efflux permease
MQQDIAAPKTRIFILVGVGIAALLGSYAVGYFGPSNNRLATLVSIGLTAIFLGCLFTAGMLALKRNRETASK